MPWHTALTLAALAVTCLLLVRELDKLRIERKHGLRLAQHRARVSLRWSSPHPEPFTRLDYLAALICARENGDLTVGSDELAAKILSFPRSRA